MLDPLSESDRLVTIIFAVLMAALTLIVVFNLAGSMGVTFSF